MARLDDLLLTAYQRICGLFGENPSSGVRPVPATLMHLSQPVANSQPQSDTGTLVAGRYYHAVQIKGTAAVDTVIVEGTINGTDWAAVAAGLAAASADGIIQFTGLWMFIRARRTAGAGVTTEVLLMSRA